MSINAPYVLLLWRVVESVIILPFVWNVIQDTISTVLIAANHALLRDVYYVILLFHLNVYLAKGDIIWTIIYVKFVI